LCDYFSNPVFRREIHTILNRGESVHQLQRAVYFGKVAPERGRQHDEMMAISGSHTLLTNLVLAWNTHRMQETVDRWRVPVGVRDQLKNLIAIVRSWSNRHRFPTLSPPMTHPAWALPCNARLTVSKRHGRRVSAWWSVSRCRRNTGARRDSHPLEDSAFARRTTQSN